MLITTEQFFSSSTPPPPSSSYPDLPITLYQNLYENNPRLKEGYTSKKFVIEMTDLQDSYFHQYPGINFVNLLKKVDNVYSNTELGHQLKQIINSENFRYSPYKFIDNLSKKTEEGLQIFDFFQKYFHYPEQAQDKFKISDIEFLSEKIELLEYKDEELSKRLKKIVESQEFKNDPQGYFETLRERLDDPDEEDLDDVYQFFKNAKKKIWNRKGESINSSSNIEDE